MKRRTFVFMLMSLMSLGFQRKIRIGDRVVLKEGVDERLFPIPIRNSIFTFQGPCKNPVILNEHYRPKEQLYRIHEEEKGIYMHVYVDEIKTYIL